MQLIIVLLIALVATCSAFSISRTSRVAVNALKMADLPDTFAFRTPNRLRFKTLSAAIDAAGLTDTLKGAGPFTIMAPTDAAFEKLAPGTLDALLADIPKLKSILTYHVVTGAVKRSDIEGMKSITTLNGKAITIDDIYLDDAKVNCFDIEADNGIIHAIDNVLLP